MPSYEIKRFNSVGIAVTVALHLLLVLLWVLKPQSEKKAPPPPSGAEMVYVTLPQSKPQPKEQPKTTPKPTTQARPSKPTVARVQRLPNTITIPNEKPVKQADTAEPPKPVKPAVVAPETDMAAAIEARRRARGQAEEQPAEESAAERGMRIAKANIAAANGRSQGDDRNDTGGVFEVKKNAMTATVKFRGWNPSFKRRWLQEVTVELGTEKDIETAVIKKMIEIIRKEKTGDFEWDSHRLQRVVTMSARVQDTAELADFLQKEMFPENRRGR